MNEANVAGARRLRRTWQASTPDPFSKAEVSLVMADMAAEIQSTVIVDENGGKTWHPDMDRVRSVVLKLARGHLHFELSVQERDDPDVFEIAPFSVLTAESREFFERPEPEPMAVWPELGSRAFLRALPLAGQMPDGWLDVQEGRYRYLVGQGHGNYAHIVIGEYLACRVAWG